MADGHLPLVIVGRAAGGALLFSLPLLMTMEMWSLAVTVNPLRIALLLALFVPALVLLSHYAGFEETVKIRHDLVDAFVALAIGAALSTAVLVLFGVIGTESTFTEAAATVALQAIPASLGALLARSQLGAADEQQREEPRRETYAGQLFLMLVGALFLAFNVAPTEEVVLIAYRITAWHALALLLATLLVMHAFVYAVQFRGTHREPEGRRQVSAFLRFTVAGYAIALLVSAYVLWTFGRLPASPVAALLPVVVLGFPAAIGAAAARLVL